MAHYVLIMPAFLIVQYHAICEIDYTSELFG